MFEDTEKRGRKWGIEKHKLITDNISTNEECK